MGQFALPLSRALSCWVSQAPPNLRAKTIGGEKIMYNKKGNPSYLVRSNTSHSGDVYKAFNNEKSAIDSSRKNSSKPNQRAGSYDIHLNRVAD